MAGLPESGEIPGFFKNNFETSDAVNQKHCIGGFAIHRMKTVETFLTRYMHKKLDITLCCVYNKIIRNRV